MSMCHVYHVLLGLNEIIPDNLLSIFDENELEVSAIITCVLCVQ